VRVVIGRSLKEIPMADGILHRYFLNNSQLLGVCQGQARRVQRLASYHARNVT
jgi:hypothetical protein